MRHVMTATGCVVAMWACACEAAPALVFSKSDLPELRRRIESEELAPAWRDILSRATDYCTRGSKQYADPEKVDSDEGFGVAAQFADRKEVLLAHHFGRRLTRWVEAIGFAYQITGEERFGRHGAALLDAAARRIPVSNPIIAKGFIGGRGDIMRAFAIGYDWLGEAMTEEQKRLVERAAADYVRNILSEARRPQAWWVPHHNYTGVAIGAAGCLSILLGQAYPNEAPGWRHECASLVRLWLDKGFDEQGAYFEGTGYANYGSSNATLFADALARSRGPNLLDHPRLRRVPHFFAMSLLPGEKVFDARNDADYGGLWDPFMLRLAGAHRDGLAKWLWERCGGGDSPLRIVWASDVPPVDPNAAGEPLAEHFAGRGLCIFRTGWHKQDVMFSVEAGPFYRVTHDQADKGHFTFYGLGYRWAIDSGYGNEGPPRGECAWNLNVREPGEYVVWARVRAGGKEPAKSDSFLVQMDAGKAIAWHMPGSREWAWGKVASGPGCKPVSFHLGAGEHVLRLKTRELEAHVDSVLVTPDLTVQPPFPKQPKGVSLEAEAGEVTRPMHSVRDDRASGGAFVETPEVAIGTGRSQTVAHNCVLVDGRGQAHTASGLGTNGKIVTYESLDRYGYVLADCTEAYNRNTQGKPGAVVRRALRHAIFIRPSHGLPAYAVVLDDIEKDDHEHDYTWLMHTDSMMDIALEPQGAIIRPAPTSAGGFVETPLGATGAGTCAWELNVPEPGEYVVWARVRARGKELGKSDSFFVQMDAGEAIAWHMPGSREWTWAKVASGIGCNRVSFHLDAGEHMLRFKTREPEANVDSILVTPDLTVQPPFPKPLKGFPLEAEAGQVTRPMRVVRDEPKAARPRMKLAIRAAAPVVLSVDAYEAHPRLKATARAVAPEFAAVLLPLPGAMAEPSVAFEPTAKGLRIGINWPKRKDLILWPNHGKRRPAVFIPD